MASIEIHLALGGIAEKTDTFVVVYLNGNPVGRTETIKNVPNPAFVQSFKFDSPTGGEMIKLEVYDEEKEKSSNLKDQHFLGGVEVPLTTIVENIRQVTSLVTRGGTPRGLFKKESTPVNIFVQPEFLHPSADVLTMQWSAKDLTNLDGIFNKSDPVLFLSRMVQDGSYLPVFRSEVVDGNLNPVWEKRNITLQRLCNGDLDRPLRAQVFDMDNNEKGRKLIGLVDTTGRALLELPTLYLQSASNKPAGSLRPLHMRLQQNPRYAGFAPGACVLQSIQGFYAQEPPSTAQSSAIPPPIENKLAQTVFDSTAQPVAVAAPMNTPIADKLSQGVDYTAAATISPAATPISDMPMAVPVQGGGDTIAPVAAPVDWLVKVNTTDGGDETTVVFINSTPRPLDVAWVDYDGGESWYARIEPGRRYEQPTYAFHVWKLAFSDTQEPLAYFVVPTSNSFVDVHGVNNLAIGANLTPMQPDEDSECIPTVVVFRNLTQNVLSIRWMESVQSEEQFAVLQPGESYRQDTYSNHVWKATYAGSNEALCFFTASHIHQQIDIGGYNKFMVSDLM